MRSSISGGGSPSPVKLIVSILGFVVLVCLCHKPLIRGRVLCLVTNL